jgi:hypothetical protein
MHSQVSARNASYFIEESRIDEDLDESDLIERVEQADGSLIACNVCGALREAS